MQGHLVSCLAKVEGANVWKRMLIELLEAMCMLTRTEHVTILIRDAEGIAIRNTQLTDDGLANRAHIHVDIRIYVVTHDPGATVT